MSAIGFDEFLVSVQKPSKTERSSSFILHDVVNFQCNIICKHPVRITVFFLWRLLSLCIFHVCFHATQKTCWELNGGKWSTSFHASLSEIRP